MESDEDIPSLRPLYRTLDKAANVVAAYISLSKDNEQPLPSLMEAAEESMRDLAKWKETVETVCGDG